MGLKPSELYALTTREFELYAEGFQRHQDNDRKFSADLFAASISPHVKGRVTGRKLYKGLPPEEAKQAMDDDEMRILAEIRSTESAINMTRGKSTEEQTEKRLDKLERLEAELQQLRKDRDMEEEWLERESAERRG